MSDWTHGYVTDVGYTFGYYGELNPHRARIPLLNVGLAAPSIGVACELGFGQGVSVNVHAAASDVRWYGTDFNPAHAAFAQSLAEAAGSDAALFDQSFAEFCARPDLPDFDYIGVHGVWSWVSDENRRVIVDFLRRKLKVGGILYISYNTQPGHAAMVPLRRLLREHAELMEAPGRGIAARIDAALDFADKLIAVNPGFTTANPAIGDRLKRLREQGRQYLAHEYFNRDWCAMLFAEMAESLAPAKLTYACSAHYHDHIDALNLTADQHRLLSEIPDPMFRQSVRDFILNQQFRREYWVKGARRLSALEQAEAVRSLRVAMLAGPRADIALTVTGPLGQRELNAEVYGRILDALGEYAPRSIGELEAALHGTEVRLPALYEAILVFLGKGDVSPVQDDAAQAAARESANRLNRSLLDKARSGGEVTVLASPVTGGGIGVSRFHQLFLRARAEGRTAPDDLARFAWNLLAAQNQFVVKDGKALQTPDENLAELEAQARDFIDKRLPALQALQIA